MDSARILLYYVFERAFHGRTHILDGLVPPRTRILSPAIGCARYDAC
jgi:hypothetical protein